MIYSFAFFLLLFVLVGVASYRYSQPTTEDYLLAGKNIKPWMAGLSLFATESSGFMFVGFIGMVYTMGLSAVWIVAGWYIGTTIMMWNTGGALRHTNEAIQAHTYSGLLSRWTGEEYKAVRILSATITIVFLSVYAAAQLSAGGKALHAMTGLDVNFSAIIGFVMVVTYCLAGGIRATIWTDAIQALAMLVSLTLIVLYGLNYIGGLNQLFIRLNDIDPGLSQLFSSSYKYGFLGFLAGWVFGGIGVIGQPHVMVRFMVLEKAENAKTVVLYYGAMVSSLLALCSIAGLCARVLLPELSLSDPELALPMLSVNYMPGALAGLFLAGLFAAAMSSADSQVLSSSAALTNDLFSKYKDNRVFVKGGTFLVALLALGIALYGSSNVFKLTTFGWSIMAAGFAPLIFLYSFGFKTTQIQAVSMMIVGASASVAWEIAGLSGDLYNVLPGMVASCLVYLSFVFLKKINF